MLQGQQDIPLTRDRAGRLLPWIVGLMIFLAVLATTGALILIRSVGSLTAGLTGTLTVHLPTAGMTAEDADKRAERAAAILRRHRAIARVRVLSRSQVGALVAPWIGADTAGLPLPRLLDVTVRRGAAINIGELRRQLRTIVPATTIVDHQRFIRGFLDVSQWIFLGGLAVALLVLVATALTIVFATRTSLRIHHNVTEVLHLIGAQDSYVARQFERHSFRQGLIGGLGGTLAAAAVLVAIVMASGERLFAGDGGLVPIWMWALLLGFPLLAALLARITARLTVLRTLARMS